MREALTLPPSLESFPTFGSPPPLDVWTCPGRVLDVSQTSGRRRRGLQQQRDATSRVPTPPPTPLPPPPPPSVAPEGRRLRLWRVVDELMLLGRRPRCVRRALNVLASAIIVPPHLSPSLPRSRPPRSGARTRVSRPALARARTSAVVAVGALIMQVLPPLLTALRPCPLHPPFAPAPAALAAALPPRRHPPLGRPPDCRRSRPRLQPRRCPRHCPRRRHPRRRRPRRRRPRCVVCPWAEPRHGARAIGRG